MENLKVTRSSRKHWFLFCIGLAFLFLTILLSELHGTTPAYAAPGTLYVDGATGQDIPACGTIIAPCQTISYTLNNRASNGDTLLVAQGTYTENLTITFSVTLEGGYESTGWSRDLAQYETIIDGSGSQPVVGDWDGKEVRKAAVIRDGAEYKMWFDGVNLLSEAQVGLATSTDGISWNKNPANPVLTGAVGAWDETGEHAPFVLKEGGIYKMWYEGSNGNVRQLGYATSANGIDWNKYAGNPVLAAGPESYDQEAAGHGSVINDAGTYKLWYHAMGDQGPIIAYATSSDGMNWTKQGPVLLPEGSSWDEGGLWGPSVLKIDSTYWMWYAAQGPLGSSIGVATSADGITWTRSLANPVLTETTPIGDPHVISDGGNLKMWYSDYELGVINYAESTDGISWTKSPGNPVLSPGTPGVWGDPVVNFAPGSDGSVLDGLTITGGAGNEAGGVHAGQASVTIRNSLIRDNFADGSPNAAAGGGVAGAFSDSASLTIIDSRIVNNNVNHGASGVRVFGGTLIMTNTIVANNHGDAGVHLNGPATLTNVTVAGNDGGILFNPPVSATLAVTNSIVYANNWSIGGPPGAGTVQATYSDIEGGWAGTGNIDADPLFVGGGDYHLQMNSPCIDTGTDTGAPDHDLDQNSRPLDGDGDGMATTDMGAYELRLYQIYLPLTLRNFTP